MGRILALSCALPLLWIGYALACSPIPGDSWFELTVALNTKTLPKGFVLRDGAIRKTDARECVLGEPEVEFGDLAGTGYVGERLDGLRPTSLAYLAKHDEYGDGRPPHVKVPKAEAVKREVFCDRQRYVTRGRFSYRRMGPNCNKWLGHDKWVGHMELDLEAVGHLITTVEAGRYCSISGDLYIERVEPAAAFCTMSAESLFDDPPAWGAQTFNHGSLSLAELARAKKHVGVDYKGRVTPQEAAETKTFEVYIDCYSSKSVIEAKIRYALKKSYDPNRSQKSAEACSRPRH